MLYIPTWSEIAAVSQSMGEDSDNPQAWKGLLGAWPIQEGGGATAFDVSGFSNHGTLTSMDPATDWVGSRFGHALNMPAANDHVRVEDKIVSNEPDASVFAWVRTTAGDTGNGRAIYSERTSVTPIWKLDSLETNHNADGSIQFVHRDDSGNITFVIANSTNLIDDGEWHRVGVTKNGTSIELWVDAEVVGSGTLNGGDTLNVTATGIGTDIVSTSNGFIGDITGLSVWKRTLSPTGIRDDYRDPWAAYRLRRRVTLLVPASGSSVLPPFLMKRSLRRRLSRVF